MSSGSINTKTQKMKIGTKAENKRDHLRINMFVLIKVYKHLQNYLHNRYMNNIFMVFRIQEKTCQKEGTIFFYG